MEEENEMRKNYWIKHQDISNIGYYFLDKNEEEEYLENMNHEFALRVGREIMKLL